MEEENLKELTSVNAKCDNCGSELFFDPRTQGLKCLSCDSRFSFAKRLDYHKHPLDEERNMDEKEHDEWVNTTKLFKCNTCGAEVVMTGLEMAKACPYCGSTYVAEQKEIEGIKPDCVVPFVFDAEQAVEKFREGIKKKFFVPSAFKKKLPSNKVNGIYFPAFLFDNKTATYYDGVLEKDHTTTRNGKTVTETKRFSIKGRLDYNFNNYIVEACSQLNEKQLNSMLPYDIGTSKTYDTNFIRGYYIENYEDSVDKCYDLAKKSMKEEIKRAILKKYDYTRVSYLNLNINYTDELYTYRLLPMYVLEYEYGKKKKKYKTYMNGQTGKIGSGLPVSPLKVTLVVSIGVIALVLIAIIILVFGE